MENLLHSYSKRSYHANGFTATASKSPYGDVFGGRAKLNNVPTLAPRLEDYAEVFGGFHSSRPHCIPVLDLPAAGYGGEEEEQPPPDFRSSGLDYSDIFGGGDKAVDFAVSYEDLLRDLSAAYDSSDEAWSPVPSELLSDESDPFACSKRHQTYRIHESRTSRNTEDRKAPIHATKDVGLNTNFGGRTSEDEQFQNFASCLVNHSFGVNGIDEEEPSENCHEYGSSLKDSTHYAFERISAETSPLSFGAEIDTSLSTEDVKDVVARAQVNCQSAKESMEKKKQSLQNYTRSSDNITTKDIMNSMFDEPAHCKDDRVLEKLVREDSQGEAFAEESERVSTGDELKHNIFYGKSSERKKGKEFGLFQEVHRIEGTVGWKEAEFFEIETCPSGDTHENDKGGKHCMDSQVRQYSLGAVTEAFEQQETCKTFIHSKVFQQLGIIGEVNKTGHRNVTDLIESEQNTNKFRAKRKPNSAHRVDDAKSIMGTDASKVNGKGPKADIEKEECDGRRKDTVRRIRDQQQQEASEREEQKEGRGIFESGMKGNKLNESLLQEEIDKKSKLENENNVKNMNLDQELVYKREYHDKEIQDTFKWDQNHKHFILKNEEPEEQYANHERVESEGGQNELRITKILNQVQDEERFSIALESESENISEDSDELECIIADSGKFEELNEKSNNIEQITIECDNVEAFDGVHASNDKIVHVPQLHENMEKFFKKLEATQAAFSYDKSEFLKAEGKDGELEPEVGAYSMLAREKLNPSTQKQDNMHYGKNQVVREATRKPPCLDAQFTNPKEYFDGVGNSSFKWENTASKNKKQIIHKGWDGSDVVPKDGEIPSIIDQRTTNSCRGRKEISSNECRNIEEQKFGRLKKEIELENEYLRKIEVEREREREREKDRMAVSRDALEKSYTDVKASIEARLRTERAAVERATAEARQRAFEKVTAEETAYDTQERVDRSSSHKFYTSSDNILTRQCSFSSDLLDHKNHEKSKLRCSYSSANAGIEGEPPQRCKARLERYQRTAERAAKALAEKNMRDLLAQKEQAERNRLAETLDAEVKRWSSGKEGNLRALLSTLQYILGPGSGWHPIPLTEVITSAAVKKAFRKASLYLHPDKLQQRGASIQQKYICEKVFDLLKEAWNKFTSEEQ